MKKIKYIVPKSYGFGASAYLPDDYADVDLADEVVQSVLRDLAMEIEITAGGVTMSLSAWMDPEDDEYSSRWAEALGDESFDDYLARLVTEWKPSS